MRALVSHTDAKALALVLRSDGWIVDIDDEPGDLAAWTGAGDFDIVVVEDPEAIRALRRAGDKTPGLVIAELPSSGRVHAYTVCGVDAVIGTPAHCDEVRAIAANLARRAHGAADATLTYGPISVDLNSKSVQVNGRALHLTRREYGLFEILVLRDRVQSKEDLMGALYSTSADDEPEIKIIDVFVCKLRKKLRLAGADGYIATIWGRGYKFDRLAA